MKTSLVLLAALGVALPAIAASAAQWWDIAPIKQLEELPEELCGEFQQLIESTTDEGQEQAREGSGVYFAIEPNRILRAEDETSDGETLEINNIVRVKGMGKTAYVVTFINSTLMWNFADSDIPTQLSVSQRDEADSSRTMRFELERLEGEE